MVSGACERDTKTEVSSGKAFHMSIADFLLFLKKKDTGSQPVNVWKVGRPSAMSLLRDFAISCEAIQLICAPVPNTTEFDALSVACSRIH